MNCRKNSRKHTKYTKKIKKQKINTKKQKIGGNNLDFILTDHALERMQERNISKKDISRILSNQKYTFSMDKKGIFNRLYLEKGKDKEDYLVILTKNVDFNKNPTIITVIRNDPIPEVYTPTAMKSLKHNKISEEQVENVLKNIIPKISSKDNERLEFDGDDLIVYTSKDQSKIISVFKKNKRKTRRYKRKSKSPKAKSPKSKSPKK